MKFLLLTLLFNNTSSFFINNLANKFDPFIDKKVKNNLIFLENVDSDKNYLFLSPQTKNYNSYIGYQSFINKLNNYGNVLLGNNLEEDDLKEYSNITLISHSSAAKESIRLSNFENINNLILIDPINIGNLEKKNNYEYDNIFDINEINKIDENLVLDNLKNFMYIDLKLSNKWQMIPFVVPIGVLKIKLKDIDISKDINVIKNDVDLYGHFDILDTKWSNFFHNTFSKGTEDRNPKNLDLLNNWLINNIRNITI